MNKLIYVETSIPSFYFETRPGPELVAAYIANKVMPEDASGDALHLALATFHHCDMLVSWNCRHIANANKSDHIHRINGRLGYDTPKLIIPLELLEESP